MGNKLSGDDHILLMNRDRILRTIERMAYQIDEDHKRENWTILVAGIKERGSVVAESLADILKSQMGHSIHQIYIPEGADKLEKISDKASFPNYFDYCLVVDDVIFSGHTMLDSLEVIRQNFKVEILRTAVLVDRGHRTVPIEASFCGMNLPTKLDEHVQVCVNEGLLNKIVLTTNSEQYGN